MFATLVPLSFPRIMTGKAVLAGKTNIVSHCMESFYDIENDVKKAEAGPMMSALCRKEYKSIHHLVES